MADENINDFAFLIFQIANWYYKLYYAFFEISSTVNTTYAIKWYYKEILHYSIWC